MTPRIHTSEPTFRAPIGQADRIRMGRVQPMAEDDKRQLAWLALIWLVIVPAIVGLYWLWRAA